MLDGAPIVAIMTGLNKTSKNGKTGAMPQVWIIRSDIHPMESLKTGADSSICGDCIHRPKTIGEDANKKSNRSCYVNMMPVNNIYKTYKSGKYQVISDLAEFAIQLTGINVRIGAYGDPAAVPIEIWDSLLSHCDSTGYTHQWKSCNTRYAEYCMASCDTPMDVIAAIAKGYRTFFVQTETYINSVDGIRIAHCPASKEMGKVTTCNKCMACNGTRHNRLSNIGIMLH
jgi:hypothetical protein